MLTTLAIINMAVAVVLINNTDIEEGSSNASLTEPTEIVITAQSDVDSRKEIDIINNTLSDYLARQDEYLFHPAPFK